MKKLMIAAAILIVSVFSIPAKAQVNVSVNISSQPLWGPVGYDYVDYYYIPAVDAYYYVPTNQYIYLSSGNWIRSNSLPAAYRNFDLYHAYKVVVNKPKPFLQHNTYIKEYGKYKNWKGNQAMIRDSKDNRYAVVKGHPLYKDNGKGSPSRNDRQPANNGNRNDNRGRPERGRE